MSWTSWAAISSRHPVSLRRESRAGDIHTMVGEHSHGGGCLRCNPIRPYPDAAMRRKTHASSGITAILCSIISAAGDAVICRLA
ncbi:uncharacterized protein N7529_005805 [Penicillium soppii]|uniref:uncharacterized protein n=1 Tax=Penicillium soppii TaxID=69789 RepID=UPI0025486633|nr:uncharacterized protein N7529_005805 [Penicillium soppii]KAJ5863889.1 hypothetical protein N7529_005805 [Penicillium soppii]